MACRGLRRGAREKTVKMVTNQSTDYLFDIDYRDSNLTWSFQLGRVLMSKAFEILSYAMIESLRDNVLLMSVKIISFY